MFDKNRHSDYMHLPIDWPRINQFPEYFTVEKGKNYSIISEKSKGRIISGERLQDGLSLRISKGETLRIIVQGV